MIQSYKQHPQLQKKYDTIIIGSGMGGLTTGAILAKEGKKVLILERHYTAGGFTHVFKRKGYEWDVWNPLYRRRASKKQHDEKTL